MMNTTKFKLKGLSKPKSFTLYTEKDDIFWASSNMSYEKFNELFDYCKGDWAENKLAIVEHDGFYEDRTPRNPVVLNIELAD